MRPQSTRRVVTIVQRRLTHYRVRLFELMREQLESSDIQFRLLHGTGTAAEELKGDEAALAWAEPLPTRYLLNGRLCWQPFAARAAGSDLIVITQENKLVNNLLALASPWRRTALAFWGHGRNMQSPNPAGLRERFKRWTTTRVEWWFAYTELSAGLVREAGFPSDAITVLNNSIDTGELGDAMHRARRATQESVRESLGLAPQAPTGVFIGSLYPDKRVDFLLQASRMVAERVPGFQLAVAGDGPERHKLETAARGGSQVHYLGPMRGDDKARLLAAGDVMLNPGLVGLGILDSFVAGLPMVTSDCGLHSPEIAYLEDAVNGLMTADDLRSYSTAVADLLGDDRRRHALGQGALAAARRYSVEAMAQRFVGGIQQCLVSTARHRAPN